MKKSQNNPFEFMVPGTMVFIDTHNTGSSLLITDHADLIPDPQGIEMQIKTIVSGVKYKDDIIMIGIILCDTNKSQYITFVNYYDRNDYDYINNLRKQDKIFFFFQADGAKTNNAFEMDNILKDFANNLYRTSEQVKPWNKTQFNTVKHRILKTMDFKDLLECTDDSLEDLKIG